MGSSQLQREIRQRKDFAGPDQEAYLNLVRTESVLTGIQFAAFKQFGLSAPLYNILRILRGADKGGLCVQEIGARMVTRVPDTTRLVDRLEQMGLAERARDTEDRRVVMVRITAKGLKLLDSIEPALRATLKQMLGHMPEKDLTALSRLLEKARAPHVCDEG
ncbi:MAG TPA: MarR family transcriptional regulator [Candidatus Hydrogenedentes bacterium]|nr:MarR family transcriptional regulator [Candidatus Hydrogenedentota bacterium]HRK36541.1 MarR family transcriptional regulator [Candidatus Hydrogenedentota bacterium]